MVTSNTGGYWEAQQTIAKSELYIVYRCDRHVPFSNPHRSQLGTVAESVISRAFIVQIEMIDLPY